MDKRDSRRLRKAVEEITVCPAHRVYNILEETVINPEEETASDEE